jgi:xylan 1,4-beta-xylosidase
MVTRQRAVALGLGALALATTTAAAQDRTDPAAAPIAVHMTVDAAKTTGRLAPIWRFFGADEPNYATMRDGRKLLTHLGALKPGDVYFRAHNLLNTGDGTSSFKWGSTNIYTEDKDGKPVYDFTVTDRIIDTYLQRGIHPYLQLGFMPQALTSAPPGEPYQHSWRPGFTYTGIEGAWNAPPKDYGKWEELAYQWTKHNVERYGRDEVLKWYFEVWNEPNLPAYWRGTPDEFFKLHDHAMAGIRRALPGARVGGADFAGSGGAFMDAFLRHVVHGANDATGGTGTPVDFLSFHAKGSPKYIQDKNGDGHVRMGISAQLKTADSGFMKIAAIPELKAKPIVIGENDPEGCAACPGAQNAYRNGTLYASYTAATYPRLWALADKRGVTLDGALTWAFEFEDQPWFAGYRQLATNGIDLPVLNTFRLFAKLGPDELAATSDGEVPLDTIEADGVTGAPDVGVLATRTAGHKLAILVWHYHDDDIPGPVAHVQLHLGGLKAKAVTVTQWRVDSDNGNAFSAWQKMGSPPSPNEKQYQAMETASVMQPQPWPAPVAVSKGAADLNFTVPRQGVSLLIVE